ncbi:FAD-dependent oxidoreductase [Pseudomonas sp. FP597]|uniref:FAD-binding oxidoreductase n=1 Tax=Pseudomonas lactucae TaxID=2813360 RepID=A0A9X0Y8Z1_9PSED|nr:MULTISPECIES: FAD-dependent oxidoreductase [Pseudomonas]MBN2975753.1 FAD-binding oxidoreductase [Pseudomonas lactucae]MBN2985921.1 FAD-binding oxidoreductase [Pseudomonas lactucae]WLI08871.1 FAD-dependent oxidoreductase [Pseudomonas sp. FP597]
MYDNLSYWFSSTEPYVPNEALSTSVTVDICIIGGGVTGLSTAYHLRKTDPHVSVALLEGQIIGYGASGRNAGQLIVAAGDNNFRAQLKRYGADKLRELHTYVHEGIDVIQTMAHEHNIDCDLSLTGYLLMGLKSEGNGKLNSYMKFSQSIFQDQFLESIPECDIANEFASAHFGSAIFDRRGGQFNPLKFIRGLKQVVMTQGTNIFEQSPVASIERNASHITLRTGRGVVRCNKLVIATNAYSHLLHGLKDVAFERNQTPIMVYANVTAPLSASQWQQLGWARRCGVNVLSDLFYSFAPTADGRLLYVGGYYTHAPSGNEMSPELSNGFMNCGPKQLATFFPKLAGVPNAQSWGGPISVTRDYIPHVGVLSDPRISYANGCWGHGMPLGARNGQTLSDLALDLQSTDTRTWFVQRDKSDWPPRAITPLIVQSVSSVMRYGVRKKASKLGMRFDPE